MPVDFLPRRDAELLLWSNRFNAYIAALVDPSVIALSAAQVTAYAALNTAFDDAMTALEAVNSTSNVVTKNTARSALKANARALSRIIQACPDTTDTQRTDMGLSIPDSLPTPRPIPAYAPAIELLDIVGHTVKLRARDPMNPDRRGKPENVAGVRLWSYVGASAPASLDSWKIQGNSTRAMFEVAISASVPAGSMIWLTAQYFNARQEPGPAGEPMSLTIGGGVSMAA